PIAPAAPPRGGPAAPAPRRGGARAKLAGTLAAACLVAGAGLLVFGGPDWTHAVGVVCLLACAVAVFALAAPPSAG
ncbi:MAG: hypothetical protein JO242_08015, partial [Streptosporangiaceae bacterium]|nr:hypothetical protein [Streptosporangiaceae bacterium]